MTQPPPPPNQPPNQPSGQPPGQPPQPSYQQPPGQPQPPYQPPAGGGFGGPQNPPAYGFPGAAPAQGGPVAGAPGPGGPAYGYPAQAPPPAQPPGPVPQQGYGYPTPAVTYQGPSTGGTGTGGSRLTRTELRMIVSAAVAVVLILGGGIWYAKSGDTAARGGDGPVTHPSRADGPTAAHEKAPADPDAKVTFRVPQPSATDLHSVEASWLTGSVYAKAGIQQIVGYDPQTGTKRWTLPLPGDVCEASPHVSADGRTGVVFDGAPRTKNTAPQACSRIGVVDLTSGRLLWNKSVTNPGGDEGIRFDDVTQSGDTVAAGSSGGGAGFDLETGAVRWKPQSSSADDCHDAGYAGGAILVASRQCGYGDDAQITVENINPKTGATLSSYKMPPGVEDIHTVSTDPLVVAADVGDTGSDGVSDFFSLDAKTGKLKAKISAEGDTYAADCADAMENCTDVLAGNGKLYLPTKEHDSNSGEALDETNEVVSFDLDTGKGTSQRADAGDGWTAQLLRMDGPDLIAYKTGPYNKGGQIVSIDPSTFRQTTLLRNPSDRATLDDETSFVASGSQVRFGDGRLFLSQEFVDKPLDADDAKHPLVMAFSTH
ncbi:outer membrane protein assembly factor BamB family protein [Streptomyces sp. NBC_01497]|uniref:outer membrane protein assembly factor BamB family protein n=1 Tax=Streptomyces sp. NBC_01497 TaxID=2903885 RepID=UPI002E3630EA|nr:PQQ-binding-like beta-propeller repeat protein [Streptomyces sp. NBC_01497]